MTGREVYYVAAFRKDGTFDHRVSISYRDRARAEENLRAYQEYCAEYTGLEYRLMTISEDDETGVFN